MKVRELVTWLKGIPSNAKVVIVLPNSNGDMVDVKISDFGYDGNDKEFVIVIEPEEVAQRKRAK